MLDVSHIRQDLAFKDIRGLEAAFHALVHYPNEESIEGSAHISELADLLGEVASSLREDDNDVPKEILDHVAEVLEPFLQRNDFKGSRYSDIANAVGNRANAFLTYNAGGG